MMVPQNSRTLLERRKFVLAQPLTGVSLKKLFLEADLSGYSEKELEIAGYSVGIVTKYVFDYVYRSGFRPECLGDSLLVAKQDFDRHAQAQTLEVLTNVLKPLDISAGQFFRERQEFERLGLYKRVERYCSRDISLPEGDVIDVVPGEKALHVGMR